MKTKDFHLGDVLSITTGYLVSPEHMGGVYNILNFMTGDELFTHQLPRACEKCRPFLTKQFPQLSKVEMKSATLKLNRSLRGKESEPERKKILNNWLAEQVAKHGEMFEVKPIPKDAHKVIDPIEEAVQTFGPERVIVAKV